MVAILRKPVIHASAWKGADLAKDASWIYPLTPAENQEIDEALRAVEGRRACSAVLRKEEFELPVLAAALTSIRDEIENGRGFVLIRGLPAEKYTVKHLETIFLGLGGHLGRSIVQNTKGSLIDHVTDRGSSFENIAVRGYATRAALTPHCDSGDIVGLLCIRAAKEGGVSTIASSVAIYNEILKTHPEYLDILYRGFHYNIRGGGPKGEWENVTRHRVPVYTYYKGRLSARFNAKSIRTAEQLPGIARLTDLENAAVDYIEELALRPDLRLDMELKPGDIQLLCNHTVLHTRSGFTDHDEPERKRLLLRIWINIPSGRELPLEFDDHYNTGPRQGPFVHEPPAVAS
jgi:Taurine catabolism dioxygenase TauD, TfdA family